MENEQEFFQAKSRERITAARLGRTRRTAQPEQLKSNEQYIQIHQATFFTWALTSLPDKSIVSLRLTLEALLWRVVLRSLPHTLCALLTARLRDSPNEKRNSVATCTLAPRRRSRGRCRCSRGGK
jgi:hypothetical protein